MRKKRLLWVIVVFTLILTSLAESKYVTDYGIPVYGESQTAPSYVLYNGVLTSELTAQDVGSNQRWVRIAGNLNREAVMATLDNANDVNFQVWNGTNWTNQNEFETSSDNSYQGIDVAYESLSNRSIIVWSKSSNQTPRYRTWNGSLSSEGYASDVGGNVRIARLASSQMKNEIILLTLDNNRDVNFQVFSNNVWHNLSELDADSWNDYLPMAATYEGLSGNALILVSDDDTNNPLYFTWNGTLSSSKTALSIGGSARFIELASNPSSNEIAAVFVDDQSDTNVMIWNGTNFTNQLELATAGNSNRKGADISYETITKKAVVVYNDGTNIIKYNTWNGTNWSTQASLADIGDKPIWIEMSSDPFSDKILTIIQDDGNDVNLFLWNGTSWTSLGELSDNQLAASTMGVGVAYTGKNDLSPNFYNMLEEQTDPSVYNPLQAYRFNITWLDDYGLGTILFNINNSNYTAANISSNYTISFTGLNVGVHSYAWIANDTSGNSNQTLTQTFTINKNSSAINLFLNNSGSNITITENTAIFLEGTTITGEGVLELYHNNLLINSSKASVSYNYLFNTTGLFNITVLHPDTQNYTSSFKTFFVNVTQTPQQDSGNSGSSSSSANIFGPSSSGTEAAKENAQSNPQQSKQAAPSNPQTSNPSQSQPAQSQEASRSNPLTGAAVAESPSQSPESSSSNKIAGLFVLESTSSITSNMAAMLALLVLGYLSIRATTRKYKNKTAQEFTGKIKKVYEKMSEFYSLHEEIPKQLIHKEPTIKEYLASDIRAQFPQTLGKFKVNNMKIETKPLPSRELRLASMEKPLIINDVKKIEKAAGKHDMLNRLKEAYND